VRECLNWNIPILKPKGEGEMRRGILIGVALVMSLAICSFLAGCKSEKKNTLEGVWERVEVRFTTAGKTESPTRKAIKIFTKNHWIILEQEPNRPKISAEATDSELLNAAKTFKAFAGTYTLKGDTLTESIEFAPPPRSIGISIPFQIRWEGDRWIQTGKFPKGAGFADDGAESYEVWKRIE
jgi:hypothetical protein